MARPTTPPRCPGSAGPRTRQILLEIGNHEAIKQAVLQRVGLGIVFQRAVARELAAGELVALPADELPMVERFLLVYRHQHRFTPVARNLIAFLRAEAPPSPAE